MGNFFLGGGEDCGAVAEAAVYLQIGPLVEAATREIAARLTPANRTCSGQLLHVVRALRHALLPPPRSPGPLPKDSTCCICLDPVLRRRDAIIFECEHFVCKSCSSDLARHTAEAGAVSTRRGVSVTCPLCRRRAKLEISN